MPEEAPESLSRLLLMAERAPESLPETRFTVGFVLKTKERGILTLVYASLPHTRVYASLPPFVGVYPDHQPVYVLPMYPVQARPAMP